jgi:hypothetical protein
MRTTLRWNSTAAHNFPEALLLNTNDVAWHKIHSSGCYEMPEEHNFKGHLWIVSMLAR